MLQTISFPGLGIEEITLSRVAFTIFGYDIYWYGIIIAAAFLFATAYILRRCPDIGIDPDRAMDVLLGGAVGGIIGARLYYVIFTWDNYKDNILDIFNPREGGLAVYGGIIGGFLVGYLICRIRKVPFTAMADATVCGIILGQSIGRWGNFVNVEAFGSNTTMPWGMAGASIVDYLSRVQVSLEAQGISVDPTLPVHPTFFYESAWCLLGFILLAFHLKKRKFDGETALLYFAWYGAGRAVIEGLRTDSLMLGSFRVSQILAIVLVAGSALLILLMRQRIQKKGLTVEQCLYIHSEQAYIREKNVSLTNETIVETDSACTSDQDARTDKKDDDNESKND